MAHSSFDLSNVLIHPDVPSYSADFGDFASFVSHMRDQATHRRRDLFVVDSGDLHHGTGLADASKPEGKASDPIFEKLYYDLLTPGNHELYYDELVDTMYKTYAPRWGRRYLTSNIFFKDIHTNETVPLGKQYTTFRGKFGTYGFMFNYKTPASNAVVEFSNDTVQKPWFQQSLKEECDIIVVMGHNPIRSPETKVVVDAIRTVHPAKPILVFGGHNHIRDFTQYDARAAGLSAGRYLETVGWMSVEGIHDPSCNGANNVEAACTNKNLTFHRRYLDTNLYTYKFHSLSHQQQEFDTWRGSKITEEIALARRELQLSKVLGRAPMDYYITKVPFDHPQNLLRLLQDEVLETVLLPSRPNPGMVVLPTGAIRYDIDKGDFTVDDAYVVCPYSFRFVYVTTKAAHAKLLVPAMNNFTEPTGSRKKPQAQSAGVKWITHPMAPMQENLTPGYVTKDDYGTGGDDWPHAAVPSYDDAPLNVASPLPEGLANDTIVDVVFGDYYTKPLMAALKSIDPNTTSVPEPYREDLTLAEMWIRFAQLKWNNNS
ncbi:hypothetical protein BGW42_004754 [Actinomortierella wolfii]|nr:hypothetical protein BGW42_004754 [Actinomortierella wolfii]